MKTKQITELLVVLNSTAMFKYPIGNKELTIKVRQLESDGIIWYDAVYSKWIRKGKGVDFRK